MVFEMETTLSEDAGESRGFRILPRDRDEKVAGVERTGSSLGLRSAFSFPCYREIFYEGKSE